MEAKNRTAGETATGNGARVRSIVDVLSTKPGCSWRREPDTINRILRYLENYSLDQIFENYGNFIDPNPEWLNPETAQKYAGCTRFWGNFYSISGVFDVITNDADVIRRLTTAIRRNQGSAAYASTKAESVAETASVAGGIKKSNLIRNGD